MDSPTLILSLSAAGAAAAAFPKLHARLALSRAKHRSLTGHSKMSKAVARLIPHYEFDLDTSTSQRLAISEPTDSLIMCVVTLGQQPEDATVNLLGPIVINRFTREAYQAVLDPSLFNVRAPLATRGV